MKAQTSGASSVRAVFTRWGECIRVASKLTAVAWVVISIIIATRSADPVFAKLASVAVVGIFPGLALMASGIVASTFLRILGFLYDRAEPYVARWSVEGWARGRHQFAAVRVWSAINLPRYWHAAMYICGRGKEGLIAAPGKVFFGVTAPIRFAARTALAVAPSLRWRFVSNAVSGA